MASTYKEHIIHPYIHTTPISPYTVTNHISTANANFLYGTHTSYDILTSQKDIPKPLPTTAYLVTCDQSSLPNGTIILSTKRLTWNVDQALDELHENLMRKVSNVIKRNPAVKEEGFVVEEAMLVKEG